MFIYCMLWDALRMDHLHDYCGCIIQSKGFKYHIQIIYSLLPPFSSANLTFPRILLLSKTKLSVLTTTPTSASLHQAPSSYGNSIISHSVYPDNLSRIMSFSPSPQQLLSHHHLPRLLQYPHSWSPCFCACLIQSILNTARVILLQFKSDHVSPLLKTLWFTQSQTGRPHSGYRV